MKALTEITKSDLIKVANLQGFENKKSDIVHLDLAKEGEVNIRNYQAGVFRLQPETMEFLKSKYILA